jgi:cytochrome P450
MISRSENSDGGFTDLELIVMTAALLIAGFDTTASLMTHGFLALLTRPDQLADLRDRPERAATAAEELVRYLAAGVGLLREVAEETHIGGQRLAKGDYVVLAVQSANRDPQLCTDPDGLDLGRRPTQHLGFGHGPHQCVGQQLARLELATVLEVLPRRLPSLRLAAPLADIPFKSDSVVRGPAILPVTWDNPVRGRRTGEAG